MIAEAWRLGPDAPVTVLLPFMEDTALGPRSRAVYSLGRLRAPAAGNRLLLVLRDPDDYTRSLAARALTRAYADTARLAPSAVSELLVRAADDPSGPVRINAVRSLGGYEDSTLSGKVVGLLNDPLPGVQVTAAEALGELGGAEAGRALGRFAAGKGSYGLRRAALLSLARTDTAAFAAAAARWRTSADWRERAAAAEGSAVAGPGKSPAFLRDRDGRVVAAGLQAWSAEVEGPDPALVAAARPLLGHADAAVRSVAADAVARAADPADLAALARMYGATRRDSFPEAALSALNAIAAIGKSSAAAQARVDREFSPDSTGRTTTFSGGGRRRTGPRRRNAGGRPFRWRPAGRCRTIATWPRRYRRRPRLPRALTCSSRPSSAADRAGTVRPRCAADRRQFPPAGRPPLLRWQQLAPGGAQLRHPGR